MPKTITVYEPDDMIDTNEVADIFGYSRDHVRHLLNINHKNADPALIRLKIATTPEWRQANGCRAFFVFRYGDVESWYISRQRKRTVKDKQWARKSAWHGIRADQIK